jgi:hypothetical protein
MMNIPIPKRRVVVSLDVGIISPNDHRNGCLMELWDGYDTALLP